jgi:uncharacterized membrane protein YobD (UPF0266 family)
VFDKNPGKMALFAVAKSLTTTVDVIFQKSGIYVAVINKDYFSNPASKTNLLLLKNFLLSFYIIFFTILDYVAQLHEQI